MEISAKIIEDSIANDIRITTMELCYPRFIHSEMLTHRMFSRNASSSRAIPIEKMLQQVQQSPAMPIHWGKNQAGMQAKEEATTKLAAKLAWSFASKKAIESAKILNDLEIHKQVVNRILEPFQWIRVIVTATEWDNFFKLRLHPDAQPEIQRLVECMKEAMLENVAIPLKMGEWHLPYVYDYEYVLFNQDKLNLDELIKCSVARCARVSYLNHDNSTPNIEKDLLLADKLLEAGHMSPFEHVCSPMKEGLWVKGMTHLMKDGSRWSSNLREWTMYRNLVC